MVCTIFWTSSIGFHVKIVVDSKNFDVDVNFSDVDVANVKTSRRVSVVWKKASPCVYPGRTQGTLGYPPT